MEANREATSTSQVVRRRNRKTANILRRIARRLNRHQTLCGREANEYLAEIKADAARWVLVLFGEILRLEESMRSQNSLARARESSGVKVKVR